MGTLVPFQALPTGGALRSPRDRRRRDRRRTDLASERTVLALERTILAWWRTGLASLAVALAVGRLLPELIDRPTAWPYELLGIAFGLYACGLFGYAAVRGRALGPGMALPFTVAATVGVLLSLATVVIIAVG